MIDISNKAEHWLTEKVQQQESYPKNVDPILWSSHIKSAIEELSRYNALPFVFSSRLVYICHFLVIWFDILYH